MLTGLIEPTQGVATVDGYDIFENLEKFRENLGVCP
jgi:ABC-type multidrug transport system ATPase subunit